MKRLRRKTKKTAQREHGKRRGKLREYVKSAVVILLLLAVTMVALEIPGEFYDHADERLMNQIIKNNYSVSVVRESMDLSQKIEALQSDDCIVAGKKELPDAGETEQWADRMAEEIDIMLDYAWQEMLMYLLRDDNTWMQLRFIEVIQVKDDKIYSFDMGILQFHSSNDIYEFARSGMILFDEETGKILYMDAMLIEYLVDVGYTDAMYEDIIVIDGSTEVTYTETGDLETDKTDMDVTEEYGTDETAFESYYDALTDYFGQTVDEDSYSYISRYSIYVCPLDGDGVTSKTMAAIFDYVYE